MARRDARSRRKVSVFLKLPALTALVLTIAFQFPLKSQTRKIPAIFMTVLNKKHQKHPYAPFQVWKYFFDTVVK
jgi:hypothetical protein